MKFLHAFLIEKRFSQSCFINVVDKNDGFNKNYWSYFSIKISKIDKEKPLSVRWCFWFIFFETLFISNTLHFLFVKKHNRISWKILNAKKRTTSLFGINRNIKFQHSETAFLRYFVSTLLNTKNIYFFIRKVFCLVF